MKWMSVWLAVASLTILAGCRHVDDSPIVAAFQKAGGGDVDQSTPDSIGQFLAKHEDLRKQLTPLCNQKKANARQTGQPRMKEKCAPEMPAPTFSENQT